MTLEDAIKAVDNATNQWREALTARITAESKELLAAQAYTAARNGTIAARGAEADAVETVRKAAQTLVDYLPAPPPLSQTT